MNTHSEHWQHIQSVLLYLAVGQIEHLPWVKNGPVGFEKKHTISKTAIYVPIDDYFVSVGLQ